jgi:predicted nucleic acid-binding protein
VNLQDDLDRIDTSIKYTVPIIYFIEAHPQFGLLSKAVVNTFQSGGLTAFSSVITLTEVLPKPLADGNVSLAKKFADFLKHGRNFNLIEISLSIAEHAGRLRGRYTDLKAIDAIQIASAIEVRADVFLTNDKKLKQVKEIKVMVLKDYL